MLPISAAATNGTSTATAAPLRQAPDAYLLDTTNLDIDAAFKAAIDLIDAALARAGYAG